MPPSPLPAALLEAALRADPARPLLTWYQPATGARVELSVVTFATWVAKTSALLCEELDVEPGSVVRVDLPAHWLGPVWAQSVWTLGGLLDLDGSGAEPVVRVQDAAEADGTGSASPAPLVVVRTAPLGGPAGSLTPPGALDYGREVPGMPDRFAPPVSPGPDVLPPGVVLPAQQRAAERGLGARALVVADRLDLDVTLDALLVPLLTGGSAVLVQGADVAPHVLADISRAERVTATTPRS
jgi:uncharacterized protein (TIGR03089 family)